LITKKSDHLFKNKLVVLNRAVREPWTGRHRYSMDFHG